MKKYLIMVLAIAISGVFVGCHEEELNGSIIDQKKLTFEDSFIRAFGQPDPTHDWGFRMPDASGVRTRGAYPNGNMWASEGWNVPPVLTDGQKERVYKYFQCHTDLTYVSPGWTNFWIQQVYKGHTDPNNTYSKTKEEYTSANGGTVIGGDHMDHLAAIDTENGIFDHIFDFNNSNNNDWEGRMLMTNSTTKSFGYFNSDGSLGHTEYTGLVHWSVIEQWGNDNKVGESLNDGWNRSFMGFDFEQVVGDDIYAHTNVEITDDKGQGTGKYQVRYATYNDCPSKDYVWDGLGTFKYGVPTSTKTDISSSFNYTWNNAESFSWDNGTLFYTGKAWGGIAMWLGGQDWSSYKKLVVEFAEATAFYSQIQIQRGDKADALVFGAESGATRIECDLTNENVTNISQVALQPGADGTLKISKIYLESKSTTTINKTDQILVDGKPIPMLVSNTNQYCGVNGDINQNDYSIYKPVLLESGQTQSWDCLNYTVIQQKVRAGYLPVIDGTMCKWVKVQGGADGYYSDWIVTLCEARQESNPDAPDVREIGGGNRYTITGQRVVESGRVMVEDLAGATGNLDDLDYNDVVFDAIIVNEYKKLVDENGGVITDYNFTEGYDKTYATVRLMAAGGTIPVELVIKDENGEHNFNVHNELGAPDGVMINTLANTPEERAAVNMATVAQTKAKTLVDKDHNNTEKFYGVEYIKDIELNVLYANVSTELVATYGAATLKFLVELGLPWAKERRNFKEGYPKFSEWVYDKSWNRTWYDERKPANLYYDNELVGLSIPEGFDYEIGPVFYDYSGQGAFKNTVSANPGTMAYPNKTTEEVLYDFTTDGVGYLCPEITTAANGLQAEEKVTIASSLTSSINVNSTIRIYGVYINDWFVTTNISDGKIISDNGNGYIDININSNNIDQLSNGITIQGKHFTVTYVSVF